MSFVSEVRVLIYGALKCEHLFLSIIIHSGSTLNFDDTDMLNIVSTLIACNFDYMKSNTHTWYLHSK